MIKESAASAGCRVFRANADLLAKKALTENVVSPEPEVISDQRARLVIAARKAREARLVLVVSKVRWVNVAPQANVASQGRRVASDLAVNVVRPVCAASLEKGGRRAFRASVDRWVSAGL